MPDNQIDISLSILSQQSGVAFQEFVNQLKGINASLDAMRRVNTAGTLEANAALNREFHGSRATSERPQGGGEPAPNTRSSGEETHRRTAERNSVFDYAMQRVYETSYWRQQAGKRSYDPRWVSESLAILTGQRAKPVDPDALSPLKIFRDNSLDFGQKLSMMADFATPRGGLMGMAKSFLSHPFVNNWLLARAFARNNGTAGDAVQATHAGWGREDLFDGPFTVGNDQFGFLLPGSGLVSEAGRHNITEKAKDWMEGLAPGFGRKDSQQVREELYRRGWVNGPARDRMYEGLKYLKQRHPGMDVGLNAEAIDQATRYGTTSVKEFVRTLSDIPEVARAAGVNFRDLQQQILEIGNATQQMGGTFAQGAQFAVQSAAITGMDPRIQQRLSENPFVQAMGMSTTGLLPQQQGLLSAGQRIAMNYDAAHQLIRMYSGFGDKEIRDQYGGVETISGYDQAVAMAADQLGIDPEVLKKMERDRKVVHAGAQLEKMTEQQKKQVDAFLESGDKESAANVLNNMEHSTTDDITTWGDMEKMLLDQKDADGNRVFSDEEIKKIKEAGDTHIKRSFLGIDSLAKDKDVSAADAANARLEEVRRIMAKKSEDENRETAGAKVEVGLAPGAEKLLKIIGVEDGDYGRRNVGQVAKAGGEAVINAVQMTTNPVLSGERLAKAVLGGIF